MFESLVAAAPKDNFFASGPIVRPTIHANGTVERVKHQPMLNIRQGTTLAEALAEHGGETTLHAVATSKLRDRMLLGDRKVQSCHTGVKPDSACRWRLQASRVRSGEPLQSLRQLGSKGLRGTRSDCGSSGPVLQSWTGRFDACLLRDLKTISFVEKSRRRHQRTSWTA